MQISAQSLDIPTLTQLREAALRALRERDFALLAQQFGYAVAFERDSARAIEEDLARIPAQLDKLTAMLLPDDVITVQFFTLDIRG